MILLQLMINQYHQFAKLDFFIIQFLIIFIIIYFINQFLIIFIRLIGLSVNVSINNGSFIGIGSIISSALFKKRFSFTAI